MLIDWNNIDTILLDMDGTILDRHFDDHFWLEHVPKRWAAKHKVGIEQARKQLHAMFRSQERTLNWTDLDYWSERLGMDIPKLKLEVDHLIAVHPGVFEFITWARHHGKQLWLVTNAHGKTVDIKLHKTRIGSWFDGIITAHQVGLPKEDPGFWDALQRFVSYNPSRTMLGEDSETNLGTAKNYGIGYLIFISRSSSAIASKKSDSYISVDYFTQLVPADGSSCVNLATHPGGQHHAQCTL
jgi:5'-nucleotidase